MINVNTFRGRKQAGDRISMVTCYDAWSAKILNATDVDCLLVGDSRLWSCTVSTPRSMRPLK